MRPRILSKLIFAKVFGDVRVGMYVRVTFWIRLGWVGFGYGFVCNCWLGKRGTQYVTANLSEDVHILLYRKAAECGNRSQEPLQIKIEAVNKAGDGSLSCPGEQSAQSAPLCASGSITYRPPKCIEALESKHIPGTWYWLYSRSDGVMAGGPNIRYTHKELF